MGETTSADRPVERVSHGRTTGTDLRETAARLLLAGLVLAGVGLVALVAVVAAVYATLLATGSLTWLLVCWTLGAAAVAAASRAFVGGDAGPRRE